ncbi:MAG: hypothetical protein K0U93_05010 [Gammaproteobacteria bacterium]|nr:hypothetical protein [Gammaproteobacteria bacterium]
MSLSTRYTQEELLKASHPCLPTDGRYWIKRCEIEISSFSPHEAESILLDLETKDGTRILLRFFAPEFDVFSPIRADS